MDRGIPTFETIPDCSKDDEYPSHSLVAKVLPDLAGVTLDKLLGVDMTRNVIVIKKTNLLSLIDQSLTATLSLTFPGGVTISTELEVLYFSDGPKFETLVNPDILTCSEADKDWFLFLPDVIAKEQQVAVTTFLPGADDFSSIFKYDKTRKGILIDPLYIGPVLKGICPSDPSF